MKSLKDIINENRVNDIDIEYINENETINEVLVHPTGDPFIDSILLGLSVSSLLLIIDFIFALDAPIPTRKWDFPIPGEATLYKIGEFFQNIRANRKGKKLLKQLLKDQDVIDFLNLPENKRTGKKWKELLQTKLSEDDYKWANAITSRLADEDGDKVKYTFYDR